MRIRKNYNQKIKFDTIIQPSNATDKQVFWEAWGTDRLRVDYNTGVVTGIKPSGVTLKAYSYDYYLGSTMVINTLDPVDFDFSSYDFKISVHDDSTEFYLNQSKFIVYDKNIYS